MRRRRLAAALGALLGTAGFGLVAIPGPLSEPAAAARAGGPPAPNIVLVMTDDQAGSQVGPLYLPRITRLLQGEGTTFENAFLTTPLCCPSRASLLTGQYGHNNGVLTNSYRYLRAQRNVLPAWLRRAGYVTAHVGKFLNRYQRNAHPTAVAPGWDQWYTQLDTSLDTYYDWDMSKNGSRRHYGSRPRDYAPRVFERAAIAFILQQGTNG
jgi:arylsulfatase A-like enzyme